MWMMGRDESGVIHAVNLDRVEVLHTEFFRPLEGEGFWAVTAKFYAHLQTVLTQNYFHADAKILTVALEPPFGRIKFDTREEAEELLREICFPEGGRRP